MAVSFPTVCTTLPRIQLTLIILVLTLAMGHVDPARLPTATPVPFLTRQLDVKIDPKEAAAILLNPSPLGNGGYSQGIVVTIDILPKQGWQVDKWVGPVYKIDGTTAQIQMDSRSLSVRLIPTTPPTATPTTVPTATPRLQLPKGLWPTATPRHTPAPSAYSYFDKGKKYYDAKNWSLAIEKFTKAIQVDPDYALAYYNLSNIYLGLSQPSLAAADKTKVCSLDSKYC